MNKDPGRYWKADLCVFLWRFLKELSDQLKCLNQSNCMVFTFQGGLLSLLLQLLGDENELTSNAARETLVDLLALFVFEGSADDKVLPQSNLWNCLFQSYYYLSINSYCVQVLIHTNPVICASSLVAVLFEFLGDGMMCGWVTCHIYSSIVSLSNVAGSCFILYE